MTIDEQIEHQQKRVDNLNALHKRLIEGEGSIPLEAVASANQVPAEVVAESIRREAAILASLVAHRVSGPMADQLLVQLAGTLLAAEGSATGENDAKEGSFGWSPAYAAVKRLRAAHDELLARTGETK